MGVSKYNTDVIKYGDPQNLPVGGGLAASVQTSNYTITEDEDVGVDSTGGTFTITLKASPEAGDVAIIRDVGQNCGTTNVAIARNGSTINGAATDENLDVDNGMYMFVYNGSTWKFTPFSGPGLNEAEVVAVTSGKKRLFLRPEGELQLGNANSPSLTYFHDSTTYLGKCYDFANAVYSRCWFAGIMPPSWDGGNVRCRFIWSPSTTNTGVVEWQTLIAYAAEGDVFPADVDGASVDDAALGVANEVQFSAWTPEFDLGPTAAETHIFAIRFQRNGGNPDDTFTGTARLLGVELEYTTNAPTDD